MPKFEAICDEAAAAAGAIEEAVKLLQRAARALAKAAGEGNPAKIRQAVGQIQQSAGQVQTAATQAERPWPLSEDEVAAYLKDGYEAELIAAALQAGVALNRLDDRLAAFPVIVQIAPAQRAVMLDKKRLAGLRPSAVARQIRERMKKPSSRPEQFIETLRKVYRLVAGKDSDGGAALHDIYDALTLLPDARKSYEKAEFARDVYELAASGVKTTRSGAAVSFSEASRGGGRIFTVIPPDGMPKYYYGVRFEEGK